MALRDFASRAGDPPSLRAWGQEGAGLPRARVEAFFLNASSWPFGRKFCLSTC
jgi:hypothetical protein